MGWCGNDLTTYTRGRAMAMQTVMVVIHGQSIHALIPELLLNTRCGKLHVINVSSVKSNAYHHRGPNQLVLVGLLRGHSCYGHVFWSGNSALW